MHGHHRGTRALTVSDTGMVLGAHRHDSRAGNWPPATTGPYGSPFGCPLPLAEPCAPAGSCLPPPLPRAVCSPPGWRGSEPPFHSEAAEGWRDLAGGVRLAPVPWDSLYGVPGVVLDASVRCTSVDRVGMGRLLHPTGGVSSRRSTGLGMAGLVMRGRNRLRGGRALLAQDDGQYEHHPKRQELALPVLQRFEPQGRGAQVLEECDRRLPVGQLLRVIVADATQPG